MAIQVLGPRLFSGNVSKGIVVMSALRFVITIQDLNSLIVGLMSLSTIGRGKATQSRRFQEAVVESLARQSSSFRLEEGSSGQGGPIGVSGRLELASARAERSQGLHDRETLRSVITLMSSTFRDSFSSLEVAEHRCDM